MRADTRCDQHPPSLPTPSRVIVHSFVDQGGGGGLSLGNSGARAEMGHHTGEITKSSLNNYGRITTLSNFSPPPRPGPPQRARTALALAGVTTIIGLAGLGIVLALSSSAGVVRGQATPAAAPASFVVPGPATPPETP